MLLRKCVLAVKLYAQQQTMRNGYLSLRLRPTPNPSCLTVLYFGTSSLPFNHLPLIALSLCSILESQDDFVQLKATQILTVLLRSVTVCAFYSL